MTSTAERKFAKQFLDELSALLDPFQSSVPTDDDYLEFFRRHTQTFDNENHPIHYLYESIFRRRDEDRLRVEILHLNIELARLRATQK